MLRGRLPSLASPSRFPGIRVFHLLSFAFFIFPLFCPQHFFSSFYNPLWQFIKARSSAARLRCLPYRYSLDSPVFLPFALFLLLFMACERFQPTFHSLSCLTLGSMGRRLAVGMRKEKETGKEAEEKGKDRAKTEPSPGRENAKSRNIWQISPSWHPCPSLPHPLLSLPFPLPISPPLCSRIRRGVGGTGVSRRPFNSAADKDEVNR